MCCPNQPLFLGQVSLLSCPAPTSTTLPYIRPVVGAAGWVWGLREPFMLLNSVNWEILLPFLQAALGEDEFFIGTTVGGDLFISRPSSSYGSFAPAALVPKENLIAWADGGDDLTRELEIITSYLRRDEAEG